MLAAQLENGDQWGRMIAGVLLMIYSGKWPGDEILGQPERFEHPDRPEPKAKENQKDEVPETNTAEILSFFKPI